MKNNNFCEALKNYFDTTPREKVLEDWAKSAEHDKMGVTVEEFLDNTNQQETLEEVKDINYWKNNCEENYITTPISVLRYISELEKEQERMYSEEEIKSAFKIGFNIGYGSPVSELDLKQQHCDKWFKQFKKK